MVSIKSLVVLGLVSIAAALPTLSTRQSDGATCGRNNYSAQDIANAQQQACRYQQNGQTVGRDKYPHQYKDYEGFQFSEPGPWYEFPILDNGRLFDGSSGPGADRVIIDDQCDLVGVLTHTGASGDDFLQCQYD